MRLESEQPLGTEIFESDSQAIKPEEDTRDDDYKKILPCKKLTPGMCSTALALKPKGAYETIEQEIDIVFSSARPGKDKSRETSDEKSLVVCDSLAASPLNLDPPDRPLDSSIPLEASIRLSHHEFEPSIVETPASEEQLAREKLQREYMEIQSQLMNCLH